VRDFAPGTWTLRVLQREHPWLDRTLAVGPAGAPARLAWPPVDGAPVTLARE
jgi:hypothetical protein